MKFFTLLFIVFTLQVVNATEAFHPFATDVDSMISFKEVQIDTVLKIKLPENHYYDDEYFEGVHSRFWSAYLEDEDVTFTVNVMNTENQACVDDMEEMRAYYQSIVESWQEEEPTMKIGDNFQHINGNVFMASLVYTQYDLEYDETYRYNFTLIQVKDQLYQILYIEPSNFKNYEYADTFFDSIDINPDFKGENQYQNCTGLDQAFVANDGKFGISAYDLGMIFGGAMCILMPVGLIIIIALILYNRKKKKKQKEWNELNS
ncbi:hypothetical protein [Nonlabens sp. YIK11]|uniref:hypothetical protein n=1 Tax=Nonlabens sp. YIK11 TaxID=1453349 RepID=UPI0012E222CE|nr:hypothetical protein [Nonlabens sp. YIK11]